MVYLSHKLPIINANKLSLKHLDIISPTNHLKIHLYMLDLVPSGLKLQYYFIHQKYFRLEAPEQDFHSNTFETGSRPCTSVLSSEFELKYSPGASN